MGLSWKIKVYVWYRVHFKLMRAVKVIDDWFYANLNYENSKLERQLGLIISMLVNKISYGVVGGSYDEIKSLRVNECNSAVYGWGFVVDNMFEGVYWAKSYKEVLDNLAWLKLEVDMARLYGELDNKGA